MGALGAWREKYFYVGFFKKLVRIWDKENLWVLGIDGTSTSFPDSIAAYNLT